MSIEREIARILSDPPVARGPGRDGAPYGERLIDWQARALLARFPQLARDDAAHRNRALTLPSLACHPERWRAAWRAYRNQHPRFDVRQWT